MMLRLDEYVKHPAVASSPSISSPDSHNSDSSIEIGDKRNAILSKQNKHLPNAQQQLPMALSKDLFLPLPFSGFPMMPPPGFLPPPTHFLFSSYHNAIYEQNHHLLQQQVQQGLLKTSDLSLAFSAKSPSIEQSKNNCDDDDDEDNVDIEEHYERSSKRNFSDSQKKSHESLSINSPSTKVPKRTSSPYKVKDEQSDDDDIDMAESDEVLTPPRSPKSPHRAHAENNPIDLSMKSGSSTKSDDINHNYYKSKTNNKSPSDSFLMNGTSDSDSNDHKTNSIYRKTIHCHEMKDGNNRKHFQINRGSEFEDDDSCCEHNGKADDASSDRNEEVEVYEREMKRRKLHLTAPLDLTTKI